MDQRPTLQERTCLMNMNNVSCEKDDHLPLRGTVNCVSKPKHNPYRYHQSQIVARVSRMYVVHAREGIHKVAQ